jgi:acyl dehydratase
VSRAPERYFEDYTPGAVFTSGAITVSEAAIIEFARQYDPQAMHTDPEAAANGRFGGLIASGWHTAALMMRLFATNFLSPASSVASPGIDELRWLQPVRPGDALHLQVTVTEGAALALPTAGGDRAQPDRGPQPRRRGGDEPKAGQPDRLPADAAR